MLALCKTTWFNYLIKGISFDQHKIEDRMTVNLNLNAGALRIVNRAQARINELGLEVSKTEATDYADLMNQDSCTRLLSLYGYTDAEIKTMIKGVKK